MNTDWLQPRWETRSTAYKDCDSTVGVWNDPPRLAAPAASGPPIEVGKGRIILLDDASIAGIRPLFGRWQGKRVACLLDDPSAADIGPGYWEPSFSLACLLPRYLFEAGIPCRRIHPSEQSGFVDENRLFYWPVSTASVDVIVWIPVKEGLISSRMRALTCRFPLRRFLEEGGELYLGGAARDYGPYLADEAEIRDAWLGVQHLALYGDPCVAGVVSDAFARLALADAGGAPLPLSRLQVAHDVAGYETCAEYADGVRLESWVSFVDQDHVALEWCVGNTGRTRCEAILSIAGNLSVAGREPVRMAASGSTLVVDLGPRLKRQARMECDVLMDPALTWTAEGEAYRAASPVLTIEPSAACRGRLMTRVVFSPAALAPAAPADAAPSPCPLRERAVERWKRTVSRVPAAAGVPHGTAVVSKALSTVLGNTWKAPAGLDHKQFGQRKIVQVQKHHYPLWAPYEAGFYASGVRLLDPALARDQVTVIRSLQRPDGWIPLVVDNDKPMEFNGLSQAPTLSFSAWQIYRADPRREFLEDVYGNLCRNIDWWREHRQPRGDGAFGFAHGQEGGGDDHPRADEPSGALRGGMKRFISPDACGFVLMEMQCLARMAAALDRPDDAALWQSRAGTLGRRTMEVCHDPRDNMFYDFETATKTFRRNISPWHFVPLWAGLPVERAQARDMIRRHLLDKLMGTVPFPIVSRDDPAYLPDAYWRGPSWPQLWPIMLQTLSWYGFAREADEAADRLVEMCHRNPYLMEIYDSRSGQGLSLPCYSFAAATLLEIVTRRYHDDPPWSIRTSCDGPEARRTRKDGRKSA